MYEWVIMIMTPFAGAIIAIVLLISLQAIFIVKSDDAMLYRMIRALHNYIATADERKVFVRFRETAHGEFVMDRDTTGTIAYIIDMIIVYYAWGNWRATLGARTISPRYMNHYSIRKALNLVPARVAMDETFKKMIDRVRSVSFIDPNHISVDFYSFDKYAINPHKKINLPRIKIDKTPSSSTVDYQKCFDVSDACLPQFEKRGLGTCTLYGEHDPDGITFDFRLDRYAEYTDMYPVTRVSMSALRISTVRVEYSFLCMHIPRSDDYCILEDMQ